MAHLDRFLPEKIELGAIETTDWNTEVVELDGGGEVRNAPWDAPRRSFEIGFHPSDQNGAVYRAVRALFEDAKGSLHSFYLRTWTDPTRMTVIPVRFDSPIKIQGLAPGLDQIATFALIEVRLD